VRARIIERVWFSWPRVSVEALLSVVMDGDGTIASLRVSVIEGYELDGR
jgi:uncharacterized tellurite resistance protein B-like protein